LPGVLLIPALATSFNRKDDHEAIPDSQGFLSTKPVLRMQEKGFTRKLTKFVFATRLKNRTYACI